MIVFIYIFFGALGLVVGSFLNVLTLRIANSEPFLAPRSYCPQCRTLLAWFDNLPLVSFVILRGRCRSCRQSISWQYPAVELATALAFVFVFRSHAGTCATPLITSFDVVGGGWSSCLWSLTILRDLIAVAGMVALFVFDFRWLIVPDEVSLPLIIISAVLNLVAGVTWSSIGLGMLVGGGFFLVLWGLSGGRWVGSGDIRLGAFLGALLGWPSTLVALYLSYLIGGIVAAVLLLLGKKKFGSMLPMGAFLMTSALVVLIFRAQILSTLPLFFPAL